MEDPRGGWLRDLTQEGVEPNPGPRRDPWRPGGRQHEFDHLRPSVAQDTPARRMSHAHGALAALEAVRGAAGQIDQ
eukprot:15435289-Alexandrium_andersonii.AAC.1